jgi:hypothetical protein
MLQKYGQDGVNENRRVDGNPLLVDEVGQLHQLIAGPDDPHKIFDAHLEGAGERIPRRKKQQLFTNECANPRVCNAPRRNSCVLSSVSSGRQQAALCPISVKGWPSGLQIVTFYNYFNL